MIAFDPGGLICLRGRSPSNARNQNYTKSKIKLHIALKAQVDEFKFYDHLCPFSIIILVFKTAASLCSKDYLIPRDGHVLLRDCGQRKITQDL